MSKELEKEANVKLKFYWGGTAGDEIDVYRKIKARQMHGGVFTFKTLADINKDVRLLEIPFSFKNRSHSQKVLNAFKNEFNQGFSKKKFVGLGIYETGQIYLVSKKDIKSVAKLKGQKLWVYQGDKLAETFSKGLNLIGVPLPLPDVLSSLQTGIVDVAYAPAIGIIALQWHSKVNYIIEPPFAYHFQGLVLSQQAFNKVPSKKRAAFKAITERYAKTISDANFAQSDQSLKAIKSKVKLIKWPSSDVKSLVTLRNKILADLGKKGIISKPAINKFKKAVNQ